MPVPPDATIGIKLADATPTSRFCTPVSGPEAVILGYTLNETAALVADVAPRLSLTPISTVDGPYAVVGVPVIWPVLESRLRPPGNVPVAT